MNSYSDLRRNKYSLCSSGVLVQVHVFVFLSFSQWGTVLKLPVLSSEDKPVPKISSLF